MNEQWADTQRRGIKFRIQKNYCESHKAAAADYKDKNMELKMNVLSRIIYAFHLSFHIHNIKTTIYYNVHMQILKIAKINIRIIWIPLVCFITSYYSHFYDIF